MEREREKESKNKILLNQLVPHWHMFHGLIYGLSIGYYRVIDEILRVAATYIPI